MKRYLFILVIIFVLFTGTSYAEGIILEFNNQEMELSSNIVYENDEIYIGLRKVIEFLDLRIEWFQEDQKIIISDYSENTIDLFIDGGHITANGANIHLDDPIVHVDGHVYINTMTLVSIISLFEEYHIEKYNNYLNVTKIPYLKNGAFTIDIDGIFTKSPSGSFPLFSYKGLKNRLYFGYYNSKNEIIVRFWDEDVEQISEPVVLWRNWGKASSGILLGDDHANPSIIVLEHQKNENSKNNGKLLVATAEHGWRLQTRRSTFEEDITTWESPIEVLEKGATYARLVELSDGRIFLLSRISWSASNSKATFYYWESSDSGDSWNGPFLLIDSIEGQEDAIYLDVVQSEESNELHFIFNLVKYNNPTNGIHRYVNIYYVNYNVNSKSWQKKDGEKITLPLSPLNIDLVYETNENDWTYLSDIKIDSNNNPFILSCNDTNWIEDSSVYLQEHFYKNGVWTTEVIGRNDRFVYPDDLNFKGPWYSNMASYDGNDINTIYTSTKDNNGVGQLEVWKRNNGNWIKEKTITNDLYGNNARPFSINNGGDSIRVLWNYITYYADSPYTEWRSMIRGLR